MLTTATIRPKTSHSAHRLSDFKSSHFPAVPAPAPESSVRSDGADLAVASNAAISPTGLAEGDIAVSAELASSSPRGRPGQCEPFRELIQNKLDQQLSAQRIWQDLTAEHGFTGGYDSVKRFSRRLGAATPLPFRRMECKPGEEAQVDFGAGAR